MKTVLNNARIIRAEDDFLGHIVIEDDKIVEVNKGLYDGESVDLEGDYLLSGFIDVHIHGSYGYDFIRDPKKSVKEVAKGLVHEGTTSFLASLTVISHSDLCDLLRGYSTVEKTEGARFLGVHSEGPFLSVEYKALMDERYLRDYQKDEFKAMIKSAGGKLKTMTFAPDRVHDDSIYDLAKENGIKLMIGHSKASAKMAKEAIDKGASGYTHLYNAMSQHTHRDPGIVTCALLKNGDYAELICDGFHIDSDVIKVTYEVLGPDKIILITDAMLGKGMQDGEYVFSNLRCKKVGNTVRVIDTGRIAGSAITQLDAMSNMMAFCGCSLNDITKMASLNPARLLGLDDTLGSIEVGKKADLIVLDKEYKLRYTYVDGILQS